VGGLGGDGGEAQVQWGKCTPPPVPDGGLRAAAPADANAPSNNLCNGVAQIAHDSVQTAIALTSATARSTSSGVLSTPGVRRAYDVA